MGKVGGGGDHDPDQLAGTTRTHPSAADSNGRDATSIARDSPPVRARCCWDAAAVGRTKTAVRLAWEILFAGLESVHELHARMLPLLSRCPFNATVRGLLLVCEVVEAATGAVLYNKCCCPQGCSEFDKNKHGVLTTPLARWTAAARPCDPYACVQEMQCPTTKEKEPRKCAKPV